jgi:multidrug efflux pump
MRIWLNPDRLRSFKMSAAEVLAKVRGQNVQFATGALGEQPAVQGQQVVAPVSAEAQFSSKGRVRERPSCAPMPMAPACV